MELTSQTFKVLHKHLRNCSTMGHASFLVMTALCCICSVGSTCIESRFLNNFNQLLSQNHVKIITGISLRRKVESFTEAIKSHSSLCNETSQNLLEEINGKVASLMETHVLEFDLSSMINNGNDNKNFKYKINASR